MYLKIWMINNKALVVGVNSNPLIYY